MLACALHKICTQLVIKEEKDRNKKAITLKHNTNKTKALCRHRKTSERHGKPL